MNLSKLFKKWRILILIFILLISYLSINPQFGAQGIVIKSVDTNSSSASAGIKNPKTNTELTNLEEIKTINNQEIKTIQDYISSIGSVKINDTVRIQTNRDSYVFLKTNDNIGLTVAEKPASNIRKGLELQGGTRVLLKPAEPITNQERDDIIQIMQNRLNTYGLTDIEIKKADDLFGNKYVNVEVAGATKQEVRELIASQGKFEAKIGNETVFVGGRDDVPFVCRNDGTCSGIRQCTKSQGSHTCRFEFAITLSPEAAKQHAEVTKNIDINVSATGQEYLALPLDLYLDNQLVDSLQIDASLKGREATQISISGPGFGKDEATALQEAVKQMNKLQTILITGSIPTKLEIAKIDTISPTLGKEFVKNALMVALFAVLAVAIVIFIRYRKLKIVIPMIITQLSEIIIILGFASLFKYNLDLAAIAGIIATVGTGIDDQIIIADEVLSKTEEFTYRWRERIKRAFFIIMAAFATTVAAMTPLLFAGAGLLTGFAIATIAGVTIGVFVTRPAFAAMTEVLLEEE